MFTKQQNPADRIKIYLKHLVLSNIMSSDQNNSNLNFKWNKII